jgi:5-(carboxyamino)imidazole ribonucleotide mutase
MSDIQVGVVMGSSSDWDTMQHAVQILKDFGIAHEARVVSAHRMPDDMFAYAEAAVGRGLKAIIAGAGGAAHLPGMIAAKTVVPVLGVPVQSKALSGVDSLHSIVQMPKGVPVATFAIGAAGAANAALFAVAMLANEDPALRHTLEAFRAAQTEAGARHDGCRLPDPQGANSPCSAVKTLLARRFKPFFPAAPRGPADHPGRDGRRPARPHVRAGRAGHGLFHGGAGPRSGQPGRAGGHFHIQTAYDDEQGLAQLMQRCDAITTEFENVPAPALVTLGAHRPVAPSAAAWRWRRTASRRRRTSCSARPSAACTRALCRHRDARAAGRRAGRSAARHSEDRAPGLRRQGPGPREGPRRAGRGLGAAGPRALRAGKAACRCRPSAR